MDEEEAATIIQAYFRGHQGRKLYAMELLKLFEKEEAKRRERERMQVWEGELLIERSTLQQEIVDQQTLEDNQLRKLNTMATRIQRVWRWYSQRRKLQTVSTSDFINSTDEQGTGDGLGLSPDSHYNGSVSTACNGHGSDITAEQYTTAQHSVFKSVQVEADDNFEFSASATVGSVEELARKVHSALQMEEEFEEMFEYPEGYLKIRQDPKSAAAAATEIAENGYSKLDHIDRQNASQKADGSTPIQLHVPQSNGITTKKDSRKELLKTGDKYRLLYSIDISDSSEEDIDEDWFHEMPEADSTSFPCAHITSRNGTGSTAEQGLVNVTDDPLLSYSDFEDEYFAGNSTNGKPSPSPPKSVKPEPSNEHSRADYDHSFTPLHAIGVAQLKQLLMSLQKRVQDTSSGLVQLLKERESLRAEKDVLTINISQTTRQLQDFYARHHAK